MGQAALERAEQQLAQGAARRAAGLRELEVARREAAELARQLADAEARAENVIEAKAGLEARERLQARETAEALPPPLSIVFLPADDL